MFKANDPQSLEKGSQALGNLFAREAADIDKLLGHETKLAEHNEALKSSHDALRKSHEDEEERHKKMCESMGEADEMKAAEAKEAAFHHAAAETEKTISAHHEAVAKEHRANADDLKARLDAMKSVAADWGGTPVLKAAGGNGGGTPIDLSKIGAGDGGNPIAAMVAETTRHLTKRTLESMDSDPDVQNYLRQTIMKMVGEAIGDKIIPDRVSGVLPPSGFRMIPRPGGPTVPDGPKVDPEFEKLVSVDE